MFKMSCGVAAPAEAPAVLTALLAWWRGKSGGGLPPRSALEPTEIGRALAYVALLDVEADDFRFRLVGEEVRARYGPLRGRRLGDLLSGGAREETLAEHRACAESCRPTLAHRTEPADDHSDEKRYWRLLLPFGEGDRATTLLAVMRFEG